MKNKQMDNRFRSADHRDMTILVFFLLALLLFAAARRWGADTRASRQWEWDPPESVGGWAMPR